MFTIRECVLIVKCGNIFCISIEYKKATFLIQQNNEMCNF